MAGGKSSADSYWPGFVDALTNVVIAMIFVVVVLAISLAFAAQMMGKRIAQKIIDEHMAKQVKVSAPASTPTQGATLTGDVAQRSPNSVAPGVIRIPVAGGQSSSGSGGGALKEVPNVLRLDFEASALTLDDKATELLRKAASPYKQVKKVVVVGRGPAMDISDNQRAVYLRVMSVRNVLLEVGFPADRIEVQMDAQTRAPSPYVTVSFTE
ncbi:hypothetical protein ACG0Z6_10990 [Roseateles sp. BYS180W]|uniref:OmpA-like domain-containing protein n=1 Tax=Roseateles rivi TaxID=3299028 RepID=A0ABW7FWP9_9BURK